MLDPRPKVLVVEDSRTNVGILVGLLQDYDVMVALDGWRTPCATRPTAATYARGSAARSSPCCSPWPTTARERLCRYLAGVVLDTPRGPLSVTVSIGVSALTADCDSLDALLAQADDRLYTAKRGGRNRVCVGA
ncbi:diguanylate cyclase [uncultured Thiodictyon sp.]|jgi:GGDEF domain-containing protein|uniref:GGDEF domain-containing protein n=1 Tax=uncultured Thiodictyon sp. TaxID=1846217 RepID=UPI0025F09281|nr:diguanylate cyclase [uncultured Thiodictyon sp.]